MPCVQSRLNRDTRTLVVYTDKEKTLLQLEMQELDVQIKQQEARGISKIYAPQFECALRVQSKFGTMPRKKVLVLIVAKTQSGKTGAMIAICKEYKEMHEIQLENIYIITGHSSTSWKKQTKGRFPNCLEKNIYHRPDFNKKGTKNKLIKELENKKNVLIIMDEVHVAAKKGQSVDKFFKKLKFNDLYYCLENDIKIVEFSATPDGTLYDLIEWGQHSALIKMKPGENYVGADDLDTQKRLHQFKDLCCKEKDGFNLNKSRENIKEIEGIILQFETPMYHIIRTLTTPLGLQTDVMNAFKGIFPVNEYEYIQYNGETKRKEELSGINDIITKPPKKHTFIFIKEMLRMAVTIHKEYLGILYERYTKRPNDSVIVQGLVGRATGYDDNGKTIIFTNIDSIVKYRNLWSGDFNNNLMIQWTSNTTKTNTTGGTESKGTFNLEATDTSKRKQQVKENHTVFNVYITQEEAREYIKEGVIKKYNIMMPKNLTKLKQGARKKEKEKDGKYQGFYIASLEDRKKGKKETMVPRLLSDVEKFQKGSPRTLGKKNEWKMRPCYRDLEDKTTLVCTVAHLDYNPNTK